jgi:hypothetical protein
MARSFVHAFSPKTFVLAATLAAAALCAGPAPAAESHDGCTYTIVSLPAVLTSQGVWCMKAELSTGIASGAAITIGTNNVTLDCNHLKLTGFAAGAGTATTGVQVNGRTAFAMRNCHVRGFRYGVRATSSVDTLIEDSLFEGNTHTGISAPSTSVGTVIRRNRVVDTGGAPGATLAIGILSGSDAHVVDNVVRGVSGDGAGETTVYGLHSTYGAGTLRGNRIQGLLPDGAAPAVGIYSLFGDGELIDDNFIHGGSYPTSIGIFCDESVFILRENTVTRIDVGYQGCVMS